MLHSNSCVRCGPDLKGGRGISDIQNHLFLAHSNPTPVKGIVSPILLADLPLLCVTCLVIWIRICRRRFLETGTWSYFWPHSALLVCTKHTNTCKLYRERTKSDSVHSLMHCNCSTWGCWCVQTHDRLLGLRAMVACLYNAFIVTVIYIHLLYLSLVPEGRQL